MTGNPDGRDGAWAGSRVPAMEMSSAASGRLAAHAVHISGDSAALLVKAAASCHRSGMTADIAIGGDFLTAHPLRAAVLGEVHARPFTPIETPRRVLHFAFETTAERGEADRAALTAFCVKRGLGAPQPASKHHRVVLGGTALRWEQHAEFTTYTWELATESRNPVPSAGRDARRSDGPRAAAGPGAGRDRPASGRRTRRAGSRPSGCSIAQASRRPRTRTAPRSTRPISRPIPAGFVRILIVDRGLGAERAGAITQRVLEIETYRTLALLGLPEAQRLAPSVRHIETRLAEVTAATRADRRAGGEPGPARPTDRARRRARGRRRREPVPLRREPRL